VANRIADPNWPSRSDNRPIDVTIPHEDCGPPAISYVENEFTRRGNRQPRPPEASVDATRTSEGCGPEHDHNSRTKACRGKNKQDRQSNAERTGAKESEHQEGNGDDDQRQ
jgi:hypothetical protein